MRARSSARSCPGATCAPAVTCTALMRAACGTLSACSIFIASSTISARPASAVSPALAWTATTRPFIGATRRPSLARRGALRRSMHGVVEAVALPADREVDAIRDHERHGFLDAVQRDPGTGRGDGDAAQHDLSVADLRAIAVIEMAQGDVGLAKPRAHDARGIVAPANSIRRNPALSASSTAAIGERFGIGLASR